MRWLLTGLLISVGVLLLVAGAVVRYILRQRRLGSEAQLEKHGDETALDLEPDSHEGD